MIKRPADLKPRFRNGALPDQADFADLIDSFLPRDAVSDADLATLREMAAWWRALPRGAGGEVAPPAPSPAVVPPAPPLPVPMPAPPAPSDSPAPPVGPGGSLRVVVPANGAWTLLPVTSRDDATWLCSASTLQPRRGFAVTGQAVAFVRDGACHLVQNFKPPFLQPWRTLQFAWRAQDGTPGYQLALRSWRSFGKNALGNDATIACIITRQAADA